MFTFAISCLTTSNLPRFMDLAFQVLIQYSLKHQALSSPSDTSTTGHCFCFGLVSSFFLELFLCSSLVAYWAPTNLEGSSSSVISFCFFILFMGFSRQNTEVVCHSFLQWIMCCQNSPPSVLGGLHGMAHNFTELDMAVVHVISLISFL